MPLVFFCDASEPRFKCTLNAILKSPEKGGLLANNLVFRYNAELVDDGVGGEEGGELSLVIRMLLYLQHILERPR